LFDVSIDNDKLVEASAVLLALVAAREAIARGDDPKNAIQYIAAAMQPNQGAGRRLERSGPLDMP
jgi:hypothetical protein